MTMTATPPGTARATLERDVTEALLRLRVARAGDDRTRVAVCEARLDWYLDRLAAHFRADGGAEP